MDDEQLAHAIERGILKNKLRFPCGCVWRAPFHHPIRFDWLFVSALEHQCVGLCEIEREITWEHKRLGGGPHYKRRWRTREGFRITIREWEHALAVARSREMANQTTMSLVATTGGFGQYNLIDDTCVALPNFNTTGVISGRLSSAGPNTTPKVKP